MALDILEAQRHIDLPDRLRAEVGDEFQHSPVEGSAPVVGLWPLGGLGRGVEVVEHELQAEPGFVGAADAGSARADCRADAAREAAEVDLRVRRAAFAAPMRVNDDDVALAHGVVSKRPLDGVPAARPRLTREGRACRGRCKDGGGEYDSYFALLHGVPVALYISASDKARKRIRRSRLVGFLAKNASLLRRSRSRSMRDSSRFTS